MPTLYYFLIDTLHLNPALAVCIAVLVPCGIVWLLGQAVAGISTYIERKVAADIQRRVGPNKCNVGSLLGDWARTVASNGKDPRAGTGGKMMASVFSLIVPVFDIADKLVLRVAPGIMIFLADGIKLIMKEDIIPDPVDIPLFKIAPTIVLASAFGALAVLPYSDAFYIADFNIGIFYIAAVTSMEVLGILMAGWASNNKWALLGGMRSAAQIVSYELPVGLAIATGILISGKMSMQAIIYDQFGMTANAAGEWTNKAASGWFWQWNLFHPAMFVLAPVYFLAALAECNRTPFDIPEAESELVSGYHTEYCGMRFAFFFMAEYMMMCVTCAIAVTLFLGGWSTGIGPLENYLFMTKAPEFSQGILTKAPMFMILGTLIHLATFCIKTYGLVFIMMWIRWTLPRFRVDQMMTLCWKKLIPLGIACFFLVSVWMVFRIFVVKWIGEQAYETATFALRLLFSLGVLAWLVWFFMKPLNAVENAQREMIAKAGLNAGVAI